MMKEDNLEKHFKNVYASQLEKELGKVLLDMEKIGLISKINILYWSKDELQYRIIKLKPYD